MFIPKPIGGVIAGPKWRWMILDETEVPHSNDNRELVLLLSDKTAIGFGGDGGLDGHIDCQISGLDYGDTFSPIHLFLVMDVMHYWPIQ